VKLVRGAKVHDVSPDPSHYELVTPVVVTNPKYPLIESM
jgi:hypothetical protein